MNGYKKVFIGMIVGAIIMWGLALYFSILVAGFRDMFNGDAMDYLYRGQAAVQYNIDNWLNIGFVDTFLLISIGGAAYMTFIAVRAKQGYNEFKLENADQIEQEKANKEKYKEKDKVAKVANNNSDKPKQPTKQNKK